MLRYEEARGKARVFKQLTGLSVDQFDTLLPAFAEAYQEAINEERQRRPLKRAPGAGRPSVLATLADKLFFILFYFRHYPTQEAQAFFFAMSQGQACHWIGRLLPVLNRAVGEELCLPARNAADLKEILGRIEDKDFIIDGTERPVRRPKDKTRQKQDYSGKKKRHTKKNIVVTDKGTGAVLGLGATQPGSKHDKKCADEEGYVFPEGSDLWQDTGFQGYQPEGAATHQPTKKPRGKELTEEQKESNREISRERVPVEHTIGKIKIFRIVADVFRGVRRGFADLAMWTACGLCNYSHGCRLPCASTG